MLYIPIQTEYELKEQFKLFNRDYYSLEAYEAMLDMFDDSELTELDVIAICCEFNEQSPYDYLIEYSSFDDNALSEMDDYEMQMIAEHRLEKNTIFRILDNGNLLYMLY